MSMSHLLDEMVSSDDELVRYYMSMSHLVDERVSSDNELVLLWSDDELVQF